MTSHSHLLNLIALQISRIELYNIRKYYWQITEDLKFWWKFERSVGTVKRGLDSPNIRLRFVDSDNSDKFTIRISYYGCKVTVDYEKFASAETHADIADALSIIEECARTTPFSRYGYTCQSHELTMDVEALAALTDKLIVDAKTAAPAEEDLGLIYQIECQLANIPVDNVDAYYYRILKDLKFWWKRGTITAETSSYWSIKLIFTYNSCECCKFTIYMSCCSNEVNVKYTPCSSHTVDDDDIIEALSVIEECAIPTLLLRQKR